jgi:hypothetical protein
MGYRDSTLANTLLLICSTSDFLRFLNPKPEPYVGSGVLLSFFLFFMCEFCTFVVHSFLKLADNIIARVEKHDVVNGHINDSVLFAYFLFV